MAESEERHVIRVSADVSGVDAPLAQADRRLNEVENSAKKTGNAFSQLGKRLSGAFKGINDKNKVSKSFEEMKRASNAFDMKKMQSEIDKTARHLDSLIARRNKMSFLGKKTDSDTFKGLQHDIDLTKTKFQELNDAMSTGLNEAIKNTKAEMENIAKTPVPTKEYEKLQDDAEKAAKAVERLRHQQAALAENYDITKSDQWGTLQDNIDHAQNQITRLKSTIASFKDVDIYGGALGQSIQQSEGLKTQLESLIATRDSMKSANPALESDFRKYVDINKQLKDTKAHFESLLAQRNVSLASGNVEDVRRLNEEMSRVRSNYKDLQIEASRMRLGDTGADIKQFGDLQIEINRTKSAIQSLDREIQKGKDSGNATYSNAYKRITDSIKETEKQIESLKAEQAAISPESVAKNSKEWQRLERSIQTATLKVEGFKHAISAMESSGKAMTPGVDTEAYAKAQADLNEYNNRLAQVTNMNQEYLKQTETGYSSLFDRIKGGAASAAQSIKKHLSQSVKKHFTEAKKHVKSFIKSLTEINTHSKATTNAVKKMTRSITSFWTMLKGRIKRLSISAVFEDMKRTVGQMALISPRFNAAVSSMIDSTKLLGAQILASVEPIVSILGPILSMIIDRISKAADTMSQFFARITGNQEYLRAIKGQSNFADSLDQTTGEMKRANAAAKEYKNTVLGFDELNKLNGVDDNSDGFLGIDHATLERAVTDKTKINAIADEIYDAFKNKDFRRAGRAIATGINDAFAWVGNVAGWSKNADKITGKLRAFIDTINGIVGNLNASQIGFVIGDVVNTIINGFDMLVDPARGINFTRIGQQLGSMLLSTVTTIEWDKLGRAIINNIQNGVRMINGILSSTIIDDVTGEKVTVGTAIGRAINDMFIGGINAVSPEEWGNVVANIVNNVNDLILEVFGDPSKAAQLADALATTINTAVAQIDSSKLGSAISSLAKSFVTFVGEMFAMIDWGGVWGSLCDILSAQNFDWGAVLTAVGILSLGSLLANSLAQPIPAAITAAVITGIKAGKDLIEQAKGLWDTHTEAVNEVKKSNEFLDLSDYGDADFRGKGYNGFEKFAEGVRLINPFADEREKGYTKIFGNETMNSVQKSLEDQTKAIVDNTGNFAAFSGHIMNAQEYVDLFKDQVAGINTEFIELDGESKKVTDQMREVAQNFIDQGKATLDLNTGMSNLKASTDNVNAGFESLITKIKETEQNLQNIVTRKSSGMYIVQESPAYVPKYANGGIVGDGQLFVANEGGVAELIGSDAQGNTAVVNNTQIIDAVTRGVKQAVLEAGMSIADRVSESQSDSGDIVLQVGEEELARATIEGQKKINRRGNHAISFA